MSVKNKVCKITARLVKKVAVNASNSVSIAGYCQPTEPKALKALKK